MFIQATLLPTGILYLLWSQPLQELDAGVSITRASDAIIDKLAPTIFDKYRGFQRVKESNSAIENIVTEPPRKYKGFNESYSIIDKLAPGAFDEYRGFQRLNDNLTYVCSAYYDDRDADAVVRIVAFARRKIEHSYTCTVRYQDEHTVDVPGQIVYHYSVLSSSSTRQR